MLFYTNALIQMIKNAHATPDKKIKIKMTVPVLHSKLQTLVHQAAEMTTVKSDGNRLDGTTSLVQPWQPGEQNPASR